LDDTIFPIDPVIHDANSVMIQTLHSLGFHGACNNEIISASKQIRHDLRMSGNEITYTELRKRSIQREIERVAIADRSDVALPTDDSVIHTVFESWLWERHTSANRNIFPFAVSSLKSIRETYPTVVIGAITNGRGNPFYMPSIAEYFDFCVSGEDAGVFPLRKPDRGIYEVALNRYSELIQFSQTAMNNHDWNWIHVGDDLANDVGASAACGAKTIWFTGANSHEADGEKGVGFWSTATPGEMKTRQELDELAKQFVDAEIHALNGLSDAIRHILNKR
jgi:putative hydrolase of the HAD superfamily